MIDLDIRDIKPKDGYKSIQVTVDGDVKVDLGFLSPDECKKLAATLADYIGELLY